MFQNEPNFSFSNRSHDWIGLQNIIISKWLIKFLNHKSLKLKGTNSVLITLIISKIVTNAIKFKLTEYLFEMLSKSYLMDLVFLYPVVTQIYSKKQLKYYSIVF